MYAAEHGVLIEVTATEHDLSKADESSVYVYYGSTDGFWTYGSQAMTGVGWGWSWISSPEWERWDVCMTNLVLVENVTCAFMAVY
jgi:hypothetical protein